MKILVANLGSTSFKYSLFDMNGEKLLARGKVERIGEAESPCTAEVNGVKLEETVCVPDHSVAVRECLAQLTKKDFGPIRDASEVAAIGFKAVHAAGISGVQRVNAQLIDAMEEFNDLLPAHNPPYVAAMRILAENLPDIPLAAAFETDFHQTIPDRNRYYGVPFDWAEKYGIRRFGFHGASHRYIAARSAELGGKKVISMHLGGSSSLCAVKEGKSMAVSMGTTPQTGLLQNNRVGDFDPFVIPYLMRKSGKTQTEILAMLSKQSGLLGLSGVGSDLRDIAEVAEKDADPVKRKRAKLALDVFVGDIRRYLGAYLVELGGADMLVFTAGIGENNPWLRRAVCADLSAFGIVLDDQKNAAAIAGRETAIHAAESRTQIWVIPTNEEIIVARQTLDMLIQSGLTSRNSCRTCCTNGSAK
ncbi:MAG: acetate/propionate family kinase [Planctomycetaceae bacterium]|jgi:acetate kinase|nr:acetate/propionate family kinase [Planctomycetaceae bacterium]